MRRRSILGYLGLKSDPSVLLHLLCQFLNHFLLLEDWAVQSVNVGLHRRLYRVTAASLPVLQWICIISLQLQKLLAGASMRIGLQSVKLRWLLAKNHLVLLIDHFSDDLVDFMVAFGIEEAHWLLLDFLSAALDWLIESVLFCGPDNRYYAKNKKWWKYMGQKLGLCVRGSSFED